MKMLFIYMISFYQKYLSFLLGKNCRFEPTCSQYAKESIEIHGAIIVEVKKVQQRNMLGSNILKK